MFNILIILPLFPTAIWLLGLSDTYLYIQKSPLLHLSLIYICIYILLLLIISIIFRNKKNKLKIENNQDKTILYFINITIAMLLLSSTYMIYNFLHLISYLSFDLARFKIRELPFTGFLSRINYWWPLSVAPLIAWLSLTNYKNKKYKVAFIIILMIFVEISSGSKAGIIWFMMVFYVSSIYFSKRLFRKSNISFFKFLLYTLFGLAGLFGLFYLYGDGTMESAISGLFHRITYGAIEGIVFVENYVSKEGESFPDFTLVKPIILFLTTFRLLEKDYFVVDSGVFLARYFNRDNDNASYTFSWIGLGYLELGELGIYLYLIILIIILILIFHKINNSKNPLMISMYISILVLYSHFLDWGWIDGILVFASIYVFLLYSLIIPLKGLLNLSSKRRNS